MSALAGTPLVEIDAALAEHGQMLAFEPPDLGPLWGGAPSRATLGGTIACNLSGPRRFKVGAARDHVLGVKGVSGRGEAFKSGGRVVKNVTGYDLSKLLCGSYGTLAVLSEVTVRTVPGPEKTRTVLALGLAASDAGAAMERAANATFEVTGLAHFPSEIAEISAVRYVADAGASVTAFRLEGPSDSVLERTRALRAALNEAWSLDCAVEELHGHNSAALWAEVGNASPFASEDFADRDIWRLSLPPAVATRSALPGDKACTYSIGQAASCGCRRRQVRTRATRRRARRWRPPVAVMQHCSARRTPCVRRCRCFSRKSQRLRRSVRGLRPVSIRAASSIRGVWWRASDANRIFIGAACRP